MFSKGNSTDQIKIVYAFGDSLTDGSTSNPDPAQKFGYINVVSQLLGWKIVNHAVGGTKIGDSTQSQYMSLIPALPKDRIVWLTGYNDMRANGTNSAGIDAYGVTLNTLLTTLSAYGCPILLGNCLKMTATGYTQGSPDFSNGSDAAVAAFNAKISTVASNFPLVTLIDVSTAFVPTNGDMQGDNVHFNFSGCYKLGNAFVSAIRTAGKN